MTITMSLTKNKYIIITSNSVDYIEIKPCIDHKQEHIQETNSVQDDVNLDKDFDVFDEHFEFPILNESPLITEPALASDYEGLHHFNFIPSANIGINNDVVTHLFSIIEELCLSRFFVIFFLLVLIHLLPYINSLINVVLNRLHNFIIILIKIIKLCVKFIQLIIEFLLNLLFNKTYQNMLGLLIAISTTNLSNAMPLGEVSENLSIPLHDIYKIVGFLGFISYVILYWLVDFLTIRIYVRRTLTAWYWKVLAGVTYCVAILIGIFSTNAIYFLLINNDVFNPYVFVVISVIGSVLSSAVWFYFSIPSRYPYRDIINSVWRAIFEAISFLCIVVFTFILWDWWILITYYNILGMVSGFIVFIPSTYFMVRLEWYRSRQLLLLLENNTNTFALYTAFGSVLQSLAFGGLFTVSWTSAVWITNPIIHYVLDGLHSLDNWIPPTISILLLTAIGTVLLWPNFYHSSYIRSFPTITWQYIIKRLLGWFLLITNYVIAAAILWDFISM